MKEISIKALAKPLCALAIASASASAMAASVTIKYNSAAYPNEMINVDTDTGTGTSFRGVSTGAFVMDVNGVSGTSDFSAGTSILSWCVELAQGLSSSNTLYNIDSSGSQSWLTSLQKLVNQRYTEVLSSASSIVSAAMQLAIWEVVSGGTNLSYGNFQAKPLSTNRADSTAAVNMAQSWLNDLNKSGTAATGDYRIVVLKNDAQQDLVTFVAPSEVPLPGAALLFLSALGVGGAVRRKRAAQQAVVA